MSVFGAREGTRTPTTSRLADFESTASAIPPHGPIKLYATDFESAAPVIPPHRRKVELISLG